MQQNVDNNKLQCNKQVEYLIKCLSLVPHKEGGMYSFPEPYECQDKVHVDKIKYKGEEIRKASTFIYFLLQAKEIATWHLLKSDEIWHFYEGTTACIIYIYDPQLKVLTTKRIGNKLRDNSTEFHALIPNGYWYAAKLENNQEGNYCLFGNTVAPGFEWQDFELIQQEQLEKHNEIIGKLLQIQ